MTRTVVAAAAVMGLLANPAAAQLGQIGRALGKAQDVRQDLTISEQEERQMGEAISAKLRDRYGVVQDAGIHRYVTLVGTVLARQSTRPGLGWTFVVLDTDGVNAFAAPGGFVHVTRGALAMLQNEAELADVLAHEIAHITEQHTLKAVRKSKGIEAASQATRREFMTQLTERAYAAVFENAFDRGDETAADRVGVTLANTVGYAPTGLSTFLTRLAERNKGVKDRSGLFASHPETTARLDALAKVVTSARLGATALVAARYGQSVKLKAAPVAAATPSNSAATAGASGGGRLGLGSLSAIGRDRDSSVSSAGSRGVNPDRDAKGGPNPAIVTVSVTSTELDTFRQGIRG